jgi:hypothetical protein
MILKRVAVLVPIAALGAFSAPAQKDMPYILIWEERDHDAHLRELALKACPKGFGITSVRVYPGKNGTLDGQPLWAWSVMCLSPGKSN